MAKHSYPCISAPKEMVSTNHVFSGFAFIGFVLISMLLPLHIRSRNIGTCAFIMWTGLLCFNGFVNSIIWDKDVTNWAPVWCDISSHLMVGGGIGIQSACLCIARHLYLFTNYAATARLGPSEVMHWGAILCDSLIVLGPPTLFIALSCIVQKFRFLIIEDIGCYFAISNIWPSYPVLYIWPLVVALITAVYGGFIVLRLIRQRAILKELVQRDEIFSRLLALVAIIFVCSLPPSLSSIVTDATENTIQPWPGWDTQHADIHKVSQIPTSAWQALGSQSIAVVQFERWVFVVYAIVFFTFFGFTGGAKEQYRLAYRFITCRAHDLVSLDAQELRNERFAGRRIVTLSTTTTQISDIPTPAVDILPLGLQRLSFTRILQSIIQVLRR